MVTLYTIACVRIIIDANSDNLSCIEILEELSVASFPNVFPKVAIIWCIARDASEPEGLPSTFHISLNDVQLYEAPVDVAFKGALRTRAIVKLAGLVITNPGRFDSNSVPRRPAAPGASRSRGHRRSSTLHRSWHRDQRGQPISKPMP